MTTTPAAEPTAHRVPLRLEVGDWGNGTTEAALLEDLPGEPSTVVRSAPLTGTELAVTDEVTNLLRRWGYRVAGDAHVDGTEYGVSVPVTAL